MPPSNPIYNHGNIWEANPKLDGYLFKCLSFFVFASYLSHLMGCKFTAGNALTSCCKRWIFCNWRSVPSLGYSIVNVILSCSKEQVTRPDTRRIVALVENPKAIWDWAVMNCPRKTMGKNFLFSNTKHTIPYANSAFTRTQPALAKTLRMFRDLAVLVYLFPKSFFWGFSFPCHNKKPPSSESVVGACWPQSPDDGEISWIRTLLSHNKAAEIMPRLIKLAI